MAPSSGPTPSGGVLKQTIVFADQRDPNSPEGRCNKKATSNGLDYIEDKFSLDFDIVCYDKITGLPFEAWMPSGGGTVHDDDTLLNSCRDHVNDHYGASWDNPDELVFCWVHQADTNGLAPIRGSIALGAEVAPPKWNHPNKGLAQHEVMHNLGADHYPSDSFLKYICGFQHQHWWGSHWHSWRSVMNYCWLGIGSNHIEQQSYDAIDPFV